MRYFLASKLKKKAAILVAFSIFFSSQVVIIKAIGEDKVSKDSLYLSVHRDSQSTLVPLLKNIPDRFNISPTNKTVTVSEFIEMLPYVAEEMYSICGDLEDITKAEESFKKISSAINILCSIKNRLEGLKIHSDEADLLYMSLGKFFSEFLENFEELTARADVYKNIIDIGQCEGIRRIVIKLAFGINIINSKIDELHVTMESKLDKIIDEVCECTGTLDPDLPVNICFEGDPEAACDGDISLRKAVFRILNRARWIRGIAKKVCDLDLENDCCFTVNSKVDELHVTMESKLDKIIDEVCECTGTLDPDLPLDICFEGDPEAACDGDISLRKAVFRILNRARWIRGIAKKVCDLDLENDCCFTVNSKVDELHVTMESKLDKIDTSVENIEITVGDINTTVNDIDTTVNIINTKVDELHVTMESKLDKVISLVENLECEGSFDADICFTVNSKVDELHVTMESKLDKIITIVEGIEECCLSVSDKIDFNFEDGPSYAYSYFTTVDQLDATDLKVKEWLKTIYRELRGDFETSVDQPC